jgi:hypothetical protein
MAPGWMMCQNAVDKYAKCTAHVQNTACPRLVSVDDKGPDIYVVAWLDSCAGEHMPIIDLNNTRWTDSFLELRGSVPVVASPMASTCKATLNKQPVNKTCDNTGNNA